MDLKSQATSMREWSTIENHGEFEVIGPVRLPCEMSRTEVEELTFKLFCFPHGQYTVLVVGDPAMYSATNPLVRISSMCVWAHLFDSLHCDCEAQLQRAKNMIVEDGTGLLIFCHDHHGKAVGLRNHFLLYAEGQRRGYELVVDAYEKLGFREDYRNYDDAATILRHFGISRLRLLTNSPRRLDALERAGFEVARVPLEAEVSQFNRSELVVKMMRLGHLLRSLKPGAQEIERE